MATPLVLWRSTVVAFVLLLSACASLPSREAAFQNERANEFMELARSGRFVIRTTADADGQQRGAQGRFEWLRFRAHQTPDQSRQVLIWVGPLGQTMGGIEQQVSPPAVATPSALRVFSDEPEPLTLVQQSAFLESLLGTPITPAEVQDLITKLMALFTQAVNSGTTLQELRLVHRGLAVDLRLVLDAR
jgi:hypothetical protein